MLSTRPRHRLWNDLITYRFIWENCCGTLLWKIAARGLQLGCLLSEAISLMFLLSYAYVWQGVILLRYVGCGVIFSWTAVGLLASEAAVKPFP
jgi:hypothetical protein